MYLTISHYLSLCLTISYFSHHLLLLSPSLTSLTNSHSLLLSTKFALYPYPGNPSTIDQNSVTNITTLSTSNDADHQSLIHVLIDTNGNMC